jgi:hypothetical protein
MTKLILELNIYCIDKIDIGVHHIDRYCIDKVDIRVHHIDRYCIDSKLTRRIELQYTTLIPMIELIDVVYDQQCCVVK